MQRETLQTYYTLLEPVIVENPLHENLVRRELTRGLGAQIPDVLDELAAGVDEYWGKDTEGWTDVSVFNVMMKIVSRATNRIFVGLPLCEICPKSSCQWDTCSQVNRSQRGISQQCSEFCAGHCD